MDYHSNMDFLKNQLKINDIFDFKGSAGEQEFKDTFLFYQENIIRNYAYGISPGYFYFKDSSKIGARAVRKKTNEFLIEINRGLIELFNRRYAYFSFDDYDNLDS